MKPSITHYSTSLATLLALCPAALANDPALPPPPPPPFQTAPGYYAILPNKILLASKVSAPADPSQTKVQWSKVSGPGEATLEQPEAAITWGKVTAPGKYVFKAVATANGKEVGSETVRVNVYPAGNHFGNPLLPGMFPDPHVRFDEGKFYIYATSMENDKGSYGRASVWTSTDFVNWEMKLTNYPEYGKFGGDIWAPDMIRKGDRYYQFITRSGGYDTWVAVADHPEGPWKNLREDNTPIVSGGGKAGRIVPAYNMDAQPFIDDDGQAYMYWGWSESMAAKLTPDLKDIDGPVIFLKGTKWLPSGGEFPQWLQVDLGESTDITKAVTFPEFRNVVYRYKIEVSDDQSSWRVLADRTQNADQTAGDGGYVDPLQGRGRYVRITFTEASGHWAGLYDFSIFAGDKKVSLGKPATASSIRGNGCEAKNAVDESNGPQLNDFVEGSYMLKHNGTYYLMYSSGVLHDGTYSVRYAMGKHPLGPFTKPENNFVIRMNEEKTTKGPGHHSIMKFNGKHYMVYHQHNQPHEDAGGVFRQTCADVMEFNADGTIKEMTPTQTGVGALQPLIPQGTNIALGMTAQATSVKTAAYVPEFALDHNNASKWRAADNTYPQTLTVKLDKLQSISRIETSFEYTTLSYKYRIETSADGTKWETYADHTANFPTAVSPHRDRKAAKASWVRITITGCERPENGAGIYEFKVFE